MLIRNPFSVKVVTPKSNVQIPPCFVNGLDNSRIIVATVNMQVKPATLLMTASPTPVVQAHFHGNGVVSM
jgi:hypothetical protein